MSYSHGGNDGGCGGGSGCGSCGSGASGGQPPAPEPSDQKLKNRMGDVKNKILVLSGKGGVGKSSVAVNLAVSLKNSGYRVGLLDVDVHGPSIPTLLGLENVQTSASAGALNPIDYEGLKVISIAFLIDDADAPVIWRGPLKMGVIRQFLEDVNWGELDFLIIDAPPGTGDEPLSVAQLLDDAKALIVTTPQKVAIADVRKSVNFCSHVNMPIIGIVENMSGMIVPGSDQRIDLFGKGGGKAMAENMNVPFIAELPIDPDAAANADLGKPFASSLPDSPLTKAFQDVTDAVAKLVQN